MEPQSTFRQAKAWGATLAEIGNLLTRHSPVIAYNVASSGSPSH